VNLKKILSGPFVWIFVAVAVMIIGSSLVSGTGFKQVDTQVGLSMIAEGKADTVKVLDGDQRVDVVLTNADAKYGKQVQFYYVAARGTQVVDTIANAPIKDGYNDEVPNTPWYLALLGSLIPFIIIGAIFWFLMSGMQGGNSKVMNFGKSRAKLVNKDTPKVTFADVAGVDEAIEELEEIKDFLKPSGNR
jgi:cell division protease FtsH